MHTFLFTNAEGKRRAARWLVTPVDGEKTLSDEELQAKPDNFLIDDLRTRLPAKPGAFDFSLQVADASDDLLDPTVAWPSTRETIPVGRLTVKSIAEGEALTACENVCLTDAVARRDRAF